MPNTFLLERRDIAQAHTPNPKIEEIGRNIRGLLAQFSLKPSTPAKPLLQYPGSQKESL